MPQDKEKLASPSNCKIPSGVQLPPNSRPEAKPHPRRRPPPFPRDSCVSWHTVNLRGAHLAPIIRTLSRLFAAPTLECSDVRLGWQETRKRVLELRRPVTVPREICSLGRMNDDRTDLEVFQQCRDLVFGDWTSAAIFVPLRVWIGEKLPPRPSDIQEGPTTAKLSPLAAAEVGG